MRTIGLIGGMSWDSSATYYRVINEEVRRRLGGHHCAEIVMVSVDFDRVRHMQQRGDWTAAGRLLADAATRLEAAGADCVVLATNLMHKVAPAIEAATGLPFLHIVDAVGAAATEAGASRVGLLGTRWVMEEPFYAHRLRERWGIEVLVPTAPDRVMIDQVIFEELTQGRIEPASRAEYARVVADLAAAGGQAAVLACTEIGLLLRPDDVDLPLIDSARVHALAAVDHALAAEPADGVPID
jgi:aspartate racemase